MWTEQHKQIMKKYFDWSVKNFACFKTMPHVNGFEVSVSNEDLSSIFSQVVYFDTDLFESQIYSLNAKIEHYQKSIQNAEIKN